MKLFIFTICIGSAINGIAQNIGIGTTNPQAPLHISSSTSAEVLRLNGPQPYISFFNTGVYQGYLWHDGNEMMLGSSTNQPVLISPYYNNFAYFTPNGRLGLGTSTPTDVLDVHGNINTTGLVKLNGSTGTAGQVFTSNGAGNPTWKNTSFTNTTRFGVGMDITGASSGYMNISSTLYNLNTTDITIGSTDITINHAGLYHFTTSYRTSVNYFSTTPPSYVPQAGIALVFQGSFYADFDIASYEFYNKDLSTTNYIYWYNKSFSGDIYLPAGTLVRGYYTLNASSTPGIGQKNGTMQVYGNLISD